MEEVLVSSAEAAHLLGISPGQLQKLVKRGVLKPHPASKSTLKKRLFRTTDLASVQEIRARGTNPEAAFVEARQAAMEVKILRRDLERMRNVLGLSMPLIGTDKDTVVNLLLRAGDALKNMPAQEADELISWARILHGLSESHFEAISFYCGHKEPWKVFLDLGKHLLSGYDPNVLKYDFEMHNVYMLVAAALRAARQTAYFHIRATYGNERAAYIIPEVKGCPHEDVIAMSLNGVPVSSI